jgi:hypothetical protein
MLHIHRIQWVVMYIHCHIYALVILTSPSSISDCKSFGFLPSPVQPPEMQVPKISFTLPASSLAIDLGAMILARLDHVLTGDVPLVL